MYSKHTKRLLIAVRLAAAAATDSTIRWIHQRYIPICCKYLAFIAVGIYGYISTMSSSAL